MRLEAVYVLITTADNISATVKAREQKHPPVRELGEVDDKYTIQSKEDNYVYYNQKWKKLLLKKLLIH